MSNKRYCIAVSMMICCSITAAALYGQNKTRYVYVPVIDGSWWNITSNPDVGKYTSPKQEPVDFAVWQAADGSWQLWSCIRGTRCGGYTRLFYRWETKNILDSNWQPKGIAMEADTSLGEGKGGLQAPFVFTEKNRWYMVYGDWYHICLASSRDGKTFTRVVNKDHSPALFGGPMINTRDPMVLKLRDSFYCYYTGHIEKNDPSVKIKSAVFCRVSADLRTWSQPVIVACGGTAATKTPWWGGDSECPFVTKIKDQYVLFRNQVYGKNNLNTQYCSPDPMDFGVNNDRYQTGQLPVAAPEIVKVKDQYFIISLKPGLNGMRMARLKFIRKKI